MPKRTRSLPDSDSEEENICDSETDSDASEIDSELEEEDTDAEEQDGDGEIHKDFLHPSRSYKRVSGEYNCTQTKLEKDYEYTWLPGENEYSEKLSNDNLLRDEDKKRFYLYLTHNYLSYFSTQS